MNIEVLQAIASTSKRSEKENHLKRADANTLDAIRRALDPFLTYGLVLDETQVASAWDSGGCLEPPETWETNLRSILDNLAARTLTGNKAKDAVDVHLKSAPTLDHAVWACRVLNKDLRAGIATKTVNKIWPNVVPTFDVALAATFDPKKHMPFPTPTYVEPKLDGLRMVVMKGRAFTRTGQEITSVGHVLEELTSIENVEDYVFDGEIMGPGDDFDKASGKIRQKQGTDDTLIYHVFDMTNFNEWGKKSQPFSKRRSKMEEIVKGMSHITLVKSLRCEDLTFEKAEQLRDEFIAQGYEGAMLKDGTSPYKHKRSSAIIKMKTFEEIDAEVVGVFEGKGKYKGSLGGLVISHDDTTTEVGSGFTDEQRHDLWSRHDEIIGMTASVKYQNKTSKNSLRFPVFLKLRVDK